ncbi:MAG TPA: DUF58 domain-containing protein [Patescibacteria group bacterium]|nr:DUF58 domain-containing protein [Patescibacteria group bacterium]
MSSPGHLVPPPASSPAQPYGRFPFAFGRRFFLALALGLVWTAPAWWNPRYLWGMVLWDAVVLAAWAWDLRRLPEPVAIEITRIWQGPVTLAGESSVALEARHSAGFPLLATLRDDAPVSLRGEAPTLEIPVPPRAVARAVYSIRPRERGDARLGSAFLRYQSPWQLAERWAAAPIAQTVRVYPNIEEAKRNTMYLIRARQTVMEKRVRHLRGRGREFESLREYRPGDESRDICWTATARRGKPIAKLFQVERSQTVWLVLDAGRLLRARSGKLSKLDYATAAALSLAQVALYSGDSVGLLVYGRKLQQRVAPGRGSRHMRGLLDALAQAHGEAVEANHLRAAETILTMQKRRSLVVWLSDLAETATTPEVVESARAMARRHLVLLAVIGQPEMRELLAKEPENAREMFRYTAAQEIVQRRDLLLRGLRQQGALALEIEPSHLSTGLVNQYLEAKDRSLI